MTFQERLLLAFNRELARRREHGEPRLTKTDIWKAAKATSGAATHWFNGSNGMDLDTCTNVAPLLRVNPFWLFDESRSVDDDVGAKKPKGGTPISLVVMESQPDYMTDEERVLLQGYRDASDDIKEAMIDMAKKASDKKADFLKRSGDA